MVKVILSLCLLFSWCCAAEGIVQLPSGSSVIELDAGLFRSGFLLVMDPDGNRVKVLPRGSRMYELSDGRTLLSDPQGWLGIINPTGGPSVTSGDDGYIRVFKSLDGSYHYTLPDGRTVIEYPSGRRVVTE